MSTKVSAQARTISLFTGKTDLDGVSSRDGSLPDLEPRRKGRAPRKYTWHGNFSEWWIENALGDTIAKIEKIDGDGYVATCKGQRQTFANIQEAGDWAVARVRGGR